MALREIRLEEDPILRKTSREITEVTDRIKILLEDMVETFIDSNFDEEPYKSMTEEELEEFAKETVANYEWTKAIMLPIEPQ